MTLRKLIIGGFLDFCRDGAAVTDTLAGTVATTSTSTAVVGTGTSFLTDLVVGDNILIGAVAKVVSAIADDTHLTISVAAASTVSGATLKRVRTSASDVLPGDDTSNWTKVSDIEDVSAKPTIDSEEVFTPSTAGGYHRSEKLIKNSKLDLEFTLQDLSEFAFELAFIAGGAITDDYTPMSGTGQIKGWWQVKNYDQAGTLVNVMKVYGEAQLNGIDFKNAVSKPKLTLSILKNELNEATLSL